MVLELRNYLWQVVAIFLIYVLLLLMATNKKKRVFLSIILDLPKWLAICTISFVTTWR